MRYNVEIRMPQREVLDLGREQALARADERAWLTVVRNNIPLRACSLQQVETIEQDEYGFGGPMLKRRYSFDVVIGRYSDADKTE